MQTLLDLLGVIHGLGDGEALRFYNGYRTWKVTYRDLDRQIGAFAGYLGRAGLHKGDRVILWAENRPEWVSAFWSCVARGIHVVPVDFRSSIDLVKRIHNEVRADLILTGDSVQWQDTDI